MSADPAPIRASYDLATADYDYPAWDGLPSRAVVVCTHPRSGSTLFGEALYHAGGLGCPLEYFHAGFRPAFEARWGVHSTMDYLAAVRRHRTDTSGVLAVKLFWRDIQELAVELEPTRLGALEAAAPDQVAPQTYRVLAELLTDLFPNPDWVHLHRRDRVRQAVSATIAVQTGRWRSIAGVEQSARGEPEYDPATIERLIGYSDFCHGHWRNLFAAIDAQPISISYEEMIGDYDASIGRVFSRLGSTAAVSPVRMQRQADAATESLVLRYLRERVGRVTP